MLHVPFKSVPRIITHTAEASLDTVTALQVPRYERIKGLRTQGVQKLNNRRGLRLVEAAYPLCKELCSGRNYDNWELKKTQLFTAF